MSTVYTGASMSLDGYIAGPSETGFEHLFQRYGDGDVAVRPGDPNMTLRMSQVSADHWRTTLELTGALVVGRKLFDAMGGWGGKHPADKPIVVLTHREAPEGWDDKPFTFVTGGIERAIAVASELAGGKGVGLNGGTIASQALDAGLLDEIWVDLVPVLLGGGTPFFSALGSVPVALEGPLKVTEGTSVTHMRYRVRR